MLSYVKSPLFEAFLRVYFCVYACVCALMHACVCVCVCAHARIISPKKNNPRKKFLSDIWSVFHPSALVVTLLTYIAFATQDTPLSVAFRDVLSPWTETADTQHETHSSRNPTEYKEMEIWYGSQWTIFQGSLDSLAKNAWKKGGDLTRSELQCSFSPLGKIKRTEAFSPLV